MAKHIDLGKSGEQKAVDFLFQNGYEILERNWFCNKAEVDIIAKKGNILIAVEVKTRTSIEFGLPQDFINDKKIRRLVKAIDTYISERNLSLEVRFDIIAIYKKNNEFNIQHIEDAFYYF